MLKFSKNNGTVFELFNFS